jgi:starch synthase
VRLEPDVQLALRLWAVGRAIDAFHDRARWRAIQENGMQQDFSWDVSAREYVKVYRG